jgi:hypothetical protein
VVIEDMFRRRWWNGDLESSKENFSIRKVRRDSLVYQEGKRQMTVTIEMGSQGFAVFIDTIGRWDDDPMNLVDSVKKTEVADRIKRALESQGETVDLI